MLVFIKVFVKRELLFRVRFRVLEKVRRVGEVGNGGESVVLFFIFRIG